MTDENGHSTGKAGIIAVLLMAAAAGGITVTNAFLEADADVATSEGGFVDHPSDPGSATRWGITEDVARAWGYDGPMQELPLSLAIEIRTAYWQRVWGDSIAEVYPSVSTRVYDAAINAGARRGARWLQECLNALNRRQRDYRDVSEDGRMGPRTMAALRRFARKRGGAGTEGERRLHACHVVRQGDHYFDLGSDNRRFENFTYGWLERIPIPLPDRTPDRVIDSLRTTITYPTEP